MNATQPEQRKPRQKSERRIRMIEAPAANDPAGYFAVEISTGKRADAYLCHAIPDGYEVEKLDAQLAAVETYVVTLDAETASCTCKGNERHRYCGTFSGTERRADSLSAGMSASALVTLDGVKVYAISAAVSALANCPHCPPLRSLLLRKSPVLQTR